MKEDKDHRIDQYFRDSLEDLNIIPPADVWNNIVRNLPEKKSSRNRIVWIAVAASVAVLAAFSGWNYLHRNSVETAETVVVQAETQKSIRTQSLPHSSGTSKAEDAQVSRSFVPEQEKPHDQVAVNVKKEKGSQSENPENEQRGKAAADAENQKVAHENISSAEWSNIALNQSHNREPLLTAIGLERLELPATAGNIIPGNLLAANNSIPVYDDIFASEDDGETQRKDRWAIGGQMAPLYSYRNITDVNAPGISKSSMNQVEKAVVTYASGIMVDFEASPRLSFQTGVYYMKMGQEIDNISNLAPPVSKMNKNLAYAADMSIATNYKHAAANSTGTIIAPAPDLYFNGSLNVQMQAYAPGNLPLSPANISKKNIEQSFEFIEVPFLAKYKIIDRKINLHLLGGVSTHVLVDNKAVLKDDNSTVEGKTTGVETLNYSSSVGFGVGYTMRKNLSINVEPTFKYYLNSFNSGDAVRLHPYAFGLYSGVMLKF